jgi:hypothetical protein
MNWTGSEWSPVATYGISGVGPSGPINRTLVAQYLLRVFFPKRFIFNRDDVHGDQKEWHKRN